MPPLLATDAESNTSKEDLRENSLEALNAALIKQCGCVNPSLFFPDFDKFSLGQILSEVDEGDGLSE